MIRRIVTKDILENILSLRFMLSMVLTISLFAAGVVVFLGRYQKQSQDYWRQTNENLSALREPASQLYKLAFYEQKALCRPKPLAFCADGFEKSLPDRITFNIFSSELPAIEGRSNFILPHFSDMDWAFIVSLILSFVALVFTYDSLCGEKETGTLALMLAGAVPRHAVLLGKYVAAMITLGIPLLIGLLISLVVVGLSKEISLQPSDWLRITIILLLSLLYLSMFVLLGLFVSGRTAHSANAMVILLLAWVGLVILIPSFGRIISDVSARSLTQMELQRKLDEASSQIWDNSDKFGERAGSMSPNLSWPGNNPPARARLQMAATEARNQIMDEQHNRLLAQVFAGRNFTCLSPTVVYQRAAEAIAGTGISHCVSLRQQVKQYQADLNQYICTEDAGDPESLHLIFNEEHCAQGWKAISHKAVDFDAVPKFQERDLAIGRSLKLAVWDIGLLVLFNLVFFAAAWISFMRYDVR
jgi:ABC-type transport system involved in multi-copper enzyme maturation permease subunit